MCCPAISSTACVWPGKIGVRYTSSPVSPAGRDCGKVVVVIAVVEVMEDEVLVVVFRPLVLDVFMVVFDVNKEVVMLVVVMFVLVLFAPST